MVVKTYRGLLADGAQDKIPLSTRDGSVGYRIVKFEIMPDGGTGARNSIISIWKKEQTLPLVQGVNFTDPDLLGMALWYNGTYEVDDAVIFDNEIFNQDIYIGLFDSDGSSSCNYYLELEQMKLDHTQNMSATLKAIRGSAVD